MIPATIIRSIFLTCAITLTQFLALKCRYAMRMRLRGVMIWRIGHDLIEGEQPLLQAVGNAMEKGN